MKAIILAAGQGTRLKKYTENIPKGMLKFKGKTIIERQIETYRKCGIDNIIIVKGYAADKINYPGITYYINYEYKTTNMVESLLTARSEFNDDVIISYADVLFEDTMLKKMMESKNDFNVAVDYDWKSYWSLRYGRYDFDTESLSLNESGYITELGRENPDIDEIDARYIGLLGFSQNGLKCICDIMVEAYRNYDGKPWQQSGKEVRKAYMTDLLNAVIQSGRDVSAVGFSHGWIEFDTNEDYENAVKWLEDGRINDIIRLTDD